LSVGAGTPSQVAVQAPVPQFIIMPAQASFPQCTSHAPLQLSCTSPQASFPPLHSRVQAWSGGQLMIAASQASTPTQLMRQA
jgi:hypothetical protein